MHAEALVLRRSLGDLRVVAASLNGLASVAVSAGDYARGLYRESLSTYAEAGNPTGADDVLRSLLALEPAPGNEPTIRRR